VKEQQLGLFAPINRPVFGQPLPRQQHDEWQPGLYAVFYSSGAWVVDELDGRSIAWIMTHWPRLASVIRLEDGQGVIERAFQIMREMGIEPA
jgi:hypothetical protein